MVPCSVFAFSQFKKLQMLILAAGFILSLFGSIPPGLISLSVSQASISRGFTAAMVLASGAALAEFFQAWLAVVLTDWFLSHPAATQGFHWASIPVFFAIGFQLIFFAKPTKPPEITESQNIPKQFVKGIFLSVFNLLAIPYWFVYCGWLRLEGWWEEGVRSTLIFSFGVSIGTIFALSLYAWLGQIILRRSSEVTRYANRFIGLIFLGLGMKVLWGLLC